MLVKKETDVGLSIGAIPLCLKSYTNLIS